MLKKTITFKNFDGHEITEDFYFHFSKAEIAKMELTQKGGSLADYLKEVLARQDGGEIITVFDRFIKESVGRRSQDGRGFQKSEEITNDFLMTDAYSELFMQLCTDAKAGAEFVQGIIPGAQDIDLEAAMTAGNALPSSETVELPSEPEVPGWLKEDRDPTQAEFQAMTPAQMQEAFARKELRLKAQQP